MARGIIQWIREVLSDPKGGYGASQDADVGLEDDGDYFTWTLDEATAAIRDPRALEVTTAYYDIGTAGEMHHHPAKNVLFVGESLEAISLRMQLSVRETAALLADGEAGLRAARAGRTVPFIDRTRYTNWNGMLAGALLRAGAVLDEPWALQHGLLTLNRIRNEHLDPAALSHSPGGMSGLLDDQVQVAQAAIEAYEATGDREWLSWSESLLDRVWNDYLDRENGGLFDTSSTGGEGLLPTRARPVQDTPTPSPNGVAALCAARLAELTQAPRWTERRDRLVAVFAGVAPELGVFGATFLLAVDWVINPAAHLVITEPAGSGEGKAMHQLALKQFAARRVVQRVSAGKTEGLPPAVAAMVGSPGLPRAFACVGGSCMAPAETIDQWRSRMEELTKRPA